MKPSPLQQQVEAKKVEMKAMEMLARKHSIFFVVGDGDVLTNSPLPIEPRRLYALCLIPL